MASGSATGDLDGFASQSAVDLPIDLGGMGCNTVLLTTRTVLYTKSTKPFELWLNCLDLRTMNGSHDSDQRFLKNKKK